MSTLRVRPETQTLEARAENETPRARLASAWLLCDITAPGPKEPGKPRRPVNLALVLDRSGSMEGLPIHLAREGTALAVEALREGDRFGVVAYDDRVDVVQPSTPATADAKAAARDRLQQIHSRGATDLHAGWLQGCEEVARGLTPDAESRCLLLTDGHANRGVTDLAEIALHATELRRRGIVTSTFGLGDDFDEALLQNMAEAGGGNAYWVRTPGEIGPAMAAETGDSLEVVARGVELVVEGYGIEEVLAPAVGRLTRGRDGRFRRSLGSLSAEQVRAETLHVRLRRRLPGRQSAVRVWLEDSDGALGRETHELVFTFQATEVAAKAPLDGHVVLATRSALVHGLVLEALHPDGRRDPARSKAKLEREGARLAELESRVPELAAILAELRETAEKLNDEQFFMDQAQVKEVYYKASYSVKGRDSEGRSRYGGADTGLDVRIAGDGVAPADLAEDAFCLQRAFADAVRGQAPVRVRTSLVTASSGGVGGPMAHAEQLRAAEAFQGKDAEGPVTLFLTSRPLEGRFFSRWHESCRVAVVSLAGIGSETKASKRSFLAYETILHGLRSAGPGWDPEHLMHPETRGCLFDYCGVRSDLDVKLHAASLCDECRERLRRARIDTGLVDALLSAVRGLSPRAGKTVR